MNRSTIRNKSGLLAAAVALVVLCAAAGDARAQWSRKWLNVGDFHHEYLSGGAEPENQAQQWNYPGLRTNVRSNRWKGLWVSALDWTDPQGKAWPIRTSHIGPRGLGIGEMFDISHEVISQFDKPRVEVDGLETFQRPVIVNKVEAAIKADRMVNSVINTSVGVTINRRAMQFAQEYNDDYHVVEYTLTNTGNIDDDPEVELPNQKLKQVYLVLLDRPTGNTPSGRGSNFPNSLDWGRYTMNDAVAPDINPQYGADFRAQFSWVGYTQERSQFHTLGNPIWYKVGDNPIRDDTLGRLGSANFVGTVILHADKYAHKPGEQAPDDIAQPRLMTYLNSDYSDLTTGNDHTDLNKMQLERDFINRGSFRDALAAPGSNPHSNPTHAWLVDKTGNFAASKNDPSLGIVGGFGYVNAYGPYDMEPGQEIKIVLAEGAAGLSDHAAYTIGRQYKLSGAKDDRLIEYDANKNGVIDANEKLTKNQWVMTARDSLFKLFRMARDNYNSGYALARPPKPPKAFNVRSGNDKITLTWEAFPGENPAGGWEVWRAANEYYGVPGAKSIQGAFGVPDSARVYSRIATLLASAKSFEDPSVQRGISYYYYLQAVGAANTNPVAGTPVGKPLKSSRYYTQTYEPAFLRRPAGNNMDEIVVVPNPYIIGSEANVRFGDKQDKIAFYGLPGAATIKIYTEIGELVTTLNHRDGSSDEFWYLLTSSRQLIASGLYLAVITNDETGEQVIRKILIVR